MTPSRIDELLEICRRATPGPWHVGHINEHDHERMDIESAEHGPIADEVRQCDVDFWFAFNPAYVEQLLLALKDARDALEQYGDNYYGVGDACPLEYRAANTALAQLDEALK